MSLSVSKTQALAIQLAIVALCVGAPSTPSAAAPADAATAEASTDTGGLDELIVTGTRQSGQRAADSPAPIQILSAEALQNAAGNPDLMSTLSQIVPSLTINAIGGDAGGLSLQAKLQIGRAHV